MLQTPACVPVGLAVLPAPCHTSMVLMGAEGRREWVLPAGAVDPKSFSSWETGNRQLQEKTVYIAPCSLRTALFTVSSDPRITPLSRIMYFCQVCPEFKDSHLFCIVILKCKPIFNGHQINRLQNDP